MPVRNLILALLLLASVSVKAQLKAEFSYDMLPTTGCSPVQVQFHAHSGSAYGNPTHFFWTGIPNASNTDSMPSVIWNTPGSYTVTLVVSNGSSQSQSFSKTIDVYPAPTINFAGSPLSGCPPLSVTFNTTGTVLGTSGSPVYTWITSSALQNITTGSPATIQFPSGLHNVTLQVTNGKGCQSSITRTAYVNVFQKPEIDFSTPVTTFCDAPTPQLTFTSTLVNATTGPYNYIWNMGQGPNQTTQNVTKSYNPPPGSYTVWLAVEDGNGCKDTMTKPQYINIIDLHANFSGPASACIFTPVTFTNISTPSGGNCTWDYGPGETPDIGQPSVTHVFVTPGTKTVRMITTSGPCVDTAYRTITIYPKPTIDFSFTPDTPCPAPITLTFTATGATSYAWNFGDAAGIQGTGNPINHLYTVCGRYSPTLYATDQHGCNDTLTKNEFVKINCADLAIMPSATRGCAPLTVNFYALLTGHVDLPYPDVFPYPNPIISYEWKFGSTGTSTSATPSYTFNSCGVYDVTLKVKTSNDCYFYDTVKIYVGTPPQASFQCDTVVCAGQPLHFYNNTVWPTGCPGIGLYEYDWTFGDGKGYTFVANPGYIYDTAGIFCAQLVAKFNGCPDTFTRCNIQVDSPVAKFTVKYNCDTPLKVVFNNSSYGTTSHTWYFGDGPTSTSTAVNPIHTYATYGIYLVRLVTFNYRSACSDTFEREIYLMNPTPVLTVTDSTICKDDHVRFMAVYTNPSFATNSYSWYINNALVNYDSAVYYTDTFVQEGYYKVKVVMEDGMGCIDSVVKPNWILTSKPSVDFTATPLTGCVPLVVNFSDLSNQVPASGGPSLPGAPLVNRKWDFGPPLAIGSYSGPNASYTYWTAGVYDVKLVVTDASGCKDSILKSQYIETYKPDADFNVNDTTSCPGTALTFTNLTTGVASCKWYFGDGDTSIAISPQHSYTQPGIYTVTMVAYDSHGCKDTAIKTNYIKITRPHAVLTISDTLAVCPPLVDTFYTTGSMGASAYWWDFQTGNHPINYKVIEPFMTPGKFAITLVAIDINGCTDTARGNVYILGYAGAFTYTPLSGCAPLEVTFKSELNNIPSIIWDFNDGNTAGSLTSPVKHTYTVPGSYLPKMIMTDGNGCTSSGNGLDTIRVDGVQARFTNSPACEGHLVTFKDSSASYFSPLTSWLWAFHDGSVSGLNGPSHFYPSPGNYKVQVIVTNGNGCTDTLDTMIVINKLPVIDAGKDTVICLQDAAQLLASGGISYVWAPAATLNCSDCPNPLASPKAETHYTVIGTDANRCSDTDAVVVGIKLKVDSKVGPGGEICDDDSITLSVSGAQRYEWTPAGNLDSSNVPEPVARPHGNTTYMVVAYEGSCIPDTNFVDVTVHPKPTVKASGAATIIAGNDAPINAEGNDIHSFLWKPTETLNCYDCPNPVAKPIRTTTYIVIATTKYGCSDSDDVTIKVLCDQSQLFIPNTFTPNGDGQNDIFYPRGVGFDNLRSFRVYNRWGELLFERSDFPLNDKANGWDGTYNGQILPPDVFVYTVEANCENGEILKWKGDITLVR